VLGFTPTLGQSGVAIEKENVLTNLELINLKNVSMFKPKEIRKRTIEAGIEKLVEKNKEHQRNLKQL